MNSNTMAEGQCKPKNLQPARKLQILELSTSVMQRELNESTILKQSSVSKRKVDIINNGTVVNIPPNITLTYNGKFVCISFIMIKTVDDKKISAFCRRSCLPVGKSHEETIQLKEQRFTKSGHTLIETILAFKIQEKAPQCLFCIGNECRAGKAKPKQCIRGDKCYYMTIRDTPNEAKGYPTMGCISDILFQKLEPTKCMNGCSSDIKYGSWKRYVCTYCCDSNLCNNSIRVQKEMEEKQNRSLKSMATQNLKLPLHVSIIVGVICVIHLIWGFTL